MSTKTKHEPKTPPPKGPGKKPEGGDPVGYRPPVEPTPDPEPVPRGGEYAHLGPTVIPIGDRVRLRCYSFSVTNTDPTRTIVQINIPFDPGPQPIVPMGPPGWVVLPGSSVTFATPPPAVGGQAVRPNGIAPGNQLSGFSFYLPANAPAGSGPVVFTFSDGSTDMLGQVFQDGVQVEADANGAFRITSRKNAFCRTLKLVAPKDADVHGVVFSRSPGGAIPGFVGVEPPVGWAANDVEPSTITIFSRGALTPIPAGKSTTTTVYYLPVNARAAWRFLDIRNLTIPGAEGIVSLL